MLNYWLSFLWLRILCFLKTFNIKLKVGIVSWGIGCYTTIPGVYADVAKATCFIDWASRCVDGTEVDNFGTSSSCTEDWAKLTYCDHKARIEFLLDEVIST